MSGRPFWKDKSLSEMSTDEWESLCDRCGKCCVLKIEDADTGEVHYTDVACKLLHCGTASCTNYPHRKRFVPDCITLSPDNLYACAEDTVGGLHHAAEGKVHRIPDAEVCRKLISISEGLPRAVGLLVLGVGRAQSGGKNISGSSES